MVGLRSALDRTWFASVRSIADALLADQVQQQRKIRGDRRWFIEVGLLKGTKLPPKLTPNPPPPIPPFDPDTDLAEFQFLGHRGILGGAHPVGSLGLRPSHDVVIRPQPTSPAEVGLASLVQPEDDVDTSALRIGDDPVIAEKPVGQGNIAGLELAI